MAKCEQKTIIADMKKSLYGNGRKGLNDRVTILQTQMYFVMGGLGSIIGLLIKLIWFK
jgi:hypothetical protein